MEQQLIDMILIDETKRSCAYCGLPMQGDALGFQETLFCAKCAKDRLAKANEALAQSHEWKHEGRFYRLTPKR